MYVWIFQTGEPLHIDKDGLRPMRAMCLANKLIKDGHKVLIISSDFYHQKKIKRTSRFANFQINKNLRIDLIPSIGYKKNIGFLRIVDHIILGINLKQYLSKKDIELPDVVFIGYPPIETSFFLISWLKKNKIKCILDVKDDWPQTFITPFSEIFRPIIKVFLLPYIYMAKSCMQRADAITSISLPLLRWVQIFSDRKEKNYNAFQNDFVAPLVREPIKIIKNNEKKDLKKIFNFKKDNYLIFVGSITSSFDFPLIYEAAKIIYKKDQNLKILIAGNGDKFNEIKILFKLSPNVILLNFVDKFTAANLIKESIGTIAPYYKFTHYERSIPNKFIESIEYGKPIITTLSGEVGNIIKNYQLGFSNCNNANDFAYASLQLYFDKKLKNQYSINCLKLFKKKYSYDIVFEKFIRSLNSLIKSKNF